MGLPWPPWFGCDRQWSCYLRRVVFLVCDFGVGWRVLLVCVWHFRQENCFSTITPAVPGVLLKRVQPSRLLLSVDLQTGYSFPFMSQAAKTYYTDMSLSLLPSAKYLGPRHPRASTQFEPFSTPSHLLTFVPDIDPCSCLRFYLSRRRTVNLQAFPVVHTVSIPSMHKLVP